MSELQRPQPVELGYLIERLRPRFDALGVTLSDDGLLIDLDMLYVEAIALLTALNSAAEDMEDEDAVIDSLTELEVCVDHLRSHATSAEARLKRLIEEL